MSQGAPAARFSPERPRAPQQQQQQQGRSLYGESTNIEGYESPSRSAASVSQQINKKKSSSCCISCLYKLIFFVCILVGVSLIIDRKENWVFDPSVLQQVAQKGIQAANAKAKFDGREAASATETVSEVLKAVKEQYPNYIHTDRDWMMNSAGGATGAMIVLHASFSEYVIIFGTPLGTEGHTGRFFAEDFFTIIYGEQWAAPAHVFEKEVYRPGSQHYLPRHQAKQYKMPGSCYALEYAIGNILSMIPFGLFDTLFSTLDWWTMYQTAEVSVTDMFGYALKGKI